MKLSNELNSLKRYPFHMPGHKRNPKFNIIGSEIDITEIDGFDNLHNAKDVLRDIESRLQSLYKSEKSFLMVNGSTVGILSAIFAVCDDGDKVIVARNCHKSVYNACMLKKLKIVYVEPEYDCENGYYTRINQKAIDKAIYKNPDAKAVIITSPTYEGMISNIKCDIPLIIDSAHGAHLFNNYPQGDIVISSLHKTMPALTQAAVANIYNKSYIDRFKLYLDIFETSSPSYIIMASVDKCLDYIDRNGYKPNKFELQLEKLRLKPVDDDCKIIISTAEADISGTELAEILRGQFNIEVEASSINYVTLITTIGDENDAIENLKNALIKIDKSIGFKQNDKIEKPICPIGIGQITIGSSVESELEKSIGKASNEFVYAYPPDIPILCPNEIITDEVVCYIKHAISKGVNLISDSGLLPNKILTKAE